MKTGLAEAARRLARALRAIARTTRLSGMGNGPTPSPTAHPG